MRLAAPLVWIAGTAMSAVPAIAQDEARIRSAIEQFETVCPAFLTDAEGFAAALPDPGPSGETPITRTADGKYTIVNTTIDGEIFGGEITVFADDVTVSCAFSLNISMDGIGPLPLETSVAIFTEWAEARSGMQVVGGLTNRRQLTGMAAMPLSPPQRIHEYHMKAIFDGHPGIGSAAMGDGFFSLYASNLE